MAYPHPTTLPLPVAAAHEGRSWSPRVVAVAALLLFAGTVYLSRAVDWRQAALFLVGGSAGVVLYHAAFGFTSSFRVFITERRGAGLRAQVLMLAAAFLLFLPGLAAGELFGQPVRGSVAPFGLAVAAGAFIFGVGMQLGGGCASGTLFTAGGGNVRMLITLLFFIVGSALGALHAHWWHQLPDVGPIALLPSLGAAGALAVNVGIFGLVFAGTLILERRRHGRLLDDPSSPRNGLARVIQGPWPLAAGAVGLALVNFATLLLAGRPWGITSALALWGSKALAAVGVDVASWPYWAGRTAALDASLAADVTTVMNVGILLGALAAAGLAGAFAPSLRIPARSLAAAVIGGLLLGYGARVAYGCNIGAYFSGVASGSLHGWLWFVAALAGTVAGTRLRPLFGLKVERRETSC